MAKRRVCSSRYRRRSRGCGGWVSSPPLRLPLQPYVLRHDKRLARQSVQRIVVMVQYEVIYTDPARGFWLAAIALQCSDLRRCVF
jgi:hypothetical protein